MSKLLITFPGQGSQFVGMGQKFLTSPFKDIAEKYFELASQTLGFNVKKLCFQGPVSELTLTQNAQPLIVTISTIYGEAFKSILKKEYQFISMGHSVGEYSALVFAKALNFTDALKLTKARGQAMQKSVPVGVGAMYAILRANDDKVREACKLAFQECNEIVEPANFNTPSQLVISGTKLGCEIAIEKLAQIDDSKFRSIPLNVSAPFHCSLMSPAQETMRKAFNDFQINKLEGSYIPNVTAKLTHSNENVKENLVQQITAPVLWSKSLETLPSELKCIDLGPGTITAGLVSKTRKDFSLLKLGDLELSSWEDIVQSFIS